MADQKQKLERRAFSVVNFRAAGEAEKRMLVGHASVFNTQADLGWYIETVAPGAFKDSISADDIRALFNHNPDYVLGRNVAKTLRLAEDDKGLAVEIDPPDTQFAKDLQISIERGDINQMSIGFEVLEQKWELLADKREKRTLLKVKLWDVSPVTFPAFAETDIAARSATDWRKSLPPPHTPMDIRRRQLDLAASTL